MSEPTWARMRTFLSVADLGSVRAAAARLHVTEPAVSAAIAHLERYLAVDLFQRAGRGITLTPAGARYADYCRHLLGLLEESAAAVRAEGAGRLRIGAVETAAESLLPDLLHRFRGAHPNVELAVSVRPRDDLFADLARHQSDVAIAGRPPSGSGLVSRLQRPHRLIVVAAPAYRIAPSTATWLLRAPGSGTRDACLALLEQREWQVPTLSLGTHGAVVAAARAGLGMALVHEDAISADLSSGDLVSVAVPGTPLDRPWHLVTNPAQLVPAAASFVALLQSPAVGFHPHNRSHG